MTAPATNIPSPLPKQQVRDTSSGLVTLFEIDTDLAVLRFVEGGTVGGGVQFNNHRYSAYPLAAKGFAWSAEGPPAHPVLELSNLSQVFDQALDGNQMRGQHVRRIITLASELDQPNAGGSCFPVESWSIDRIARLDRSLLRIELVAAASLEHRQYPSRVMMRDICQHRYRRWDAERRRFDYAGVTCPYTGAQTYRADGAPTRNQSEDSCSLTIRTGCSKRFQQVMPFLGFPGLVRQ
jgi:lambda family phage minor tail protein L